MSSSSLIPTDRWSEHWRRAGVDVERRRLLVTNFANTEQETDLTEPANCDGFGRIRNFRRQTSPGWPSNPLPIDPVGARLRLERSDHIQAQVFQNAVCNWRCWYCFVPYNLLSADQKHADWLTADQLVESYLSLPERPPMIDPDGWPARPRSGVGSVDDGGPKGSRASR